MSTARQITKIFAGNSNMALAENICLELGKKLGADVTLGDSIVTKFSDGEVSVSINETVRGDDVFIIQSTCHPVNDNLMELLIMIDAMRRASANRITAVIPYFGYARQDRKAKSHDPISAKLVANLLTTAGAHRVLTMDLHAPQIQGFFDIPVDNMYGRPIFTDYYIEKFGEHAEDVICMAPDVGSVARARLFAQRLGVGFAIVDKRHTEGADTEVMNIIGDVRGKKIILVDDMVDTAGSMCNAAQAIVDEGGANEDEIYACASHGVLSGSAIERINKSPIKEFMLLDTVPHHGEPSDKIKRLSVGELFAEAIKRIHEEEALSPLF